MYEETLFQDWLSERAEKYGKKINTARSVEMHRNKLTKWADIGYDCNAIIRHAIEVGWRGLFLPHGMEPKQQHLKASPGPLFDQVNSLVEKTKIPERSNPEYQRKAVEALRQVLAE
jgi:hypothetical protein